MGCELNICIRWYTVAEDNLSWFCGALGAMGFGSGRGNLGGNQAMQLLGDAAAYFGGVFGKCIGFGQKQR